MTSTSTRLLVVLLVFSFVLVAPHVALAAGPGSAPMAGFLQGLLDWLSGTIGPIVFGLGLVIALFSMIFGQPGGLMRALTVCIAGAALFSIGKIMAFVVTLSQ